jgi:VWFA-related protein
MTCWMKITFLVMASMVAAQPPTTFRTGTKLVQVDVVVRDKKGPAAGLTRQDFTLLDDGKQQEIAVFAVKSAAVSAQPLRAPVLPLPPGAISNRVNSEGEARGADTVILIDQKNTLQASQAWAIGRVVKFIEARRGKDRIGIYAFGRDGLQAVQELTDDAEALKRAAKSLKARDPVYRDTDTTGMTERAASEYGLQLMLERMLDTKHALQAVARHLAKVPGRKNLIWITQGFPLKGRDFDFTSQMEEAARALNDANLALYAADARGLAATGSGSGVPTAEVSPVRPGAIALPIPMRASSPPPPGGVDPMFLLARLTGGDVYLDTNGIEDSIQSAIEDAELTYTLGFYPAQEMQDGQTHKLTVKVARKGVTVRHRENYSASSALAATEERPTLDQLMVDTLDATQIGLSVQAAPDAARPGWFNVRVSVDLHDVKLEHQGTQWTGAIEVSIHPEGSTVLRQVTRKIEIAEDQLAAGLEKGIEIETPTEAAGVVRVVVQDQGSPAAGSVRIRL